MKKFGGKNFGKEKIFQVPFKYHSNTPLAFKQKLFNQFN